MSKVQRILSENIKHSTFEEHQTVGTDEETMAWEIVKAYRRIERLEVMIRDLLGAQQLSTKGGEKE